jgi:hypothetical protein
VSRGDEPEIGHPAQQLGNTFAHQATVFDEHDGNHLHSGRREQRY